MTLISKSSGILIATAAAALFSAGSVTAADSGADAQKAEVHCFGVNACKGQAACKTAQNECKGQNSCKGHGFVAAASEKACADQGGTLTES
jgi:hypothetical protein